MLVCGILGCRVRATLLALLLWAAHATRPMSVGAVGDTPSSSSSLFQARAMDKDLLVTVLKKTHGAIDRGRLKQARTSALYLVSLLEDLLEANPAPVGSGGAGTAGTAYTGTSNRGTLGDTSSSFRGRSRDSDIANAHADNDASASSRGRNVSAWSSQGISQVREAEGDGTSTDGGMDSNGPASKANSLHVGEKLLQLEENLSEMRSKLGRAIADNQFHLALKVKQIIEELHKQIEELKQKMATSQNTSDSGGTVGPRDKTLADFINEGATAQNTDALAVNSNNVNPADAFKSNVVRSWSSQENQLPVSHSVSDSAATAVKTTLKREKLEQLFQEALVKRDFVQAQQLQKQIAELKNDL